MASSTRAREGCCCVLSCLLLYVPYMPSYHYAISLSSLCVGDNSLLLVGGRTERAGICVTGFILAQQRQHTHRVLEKRQRRARQKYSWHTSSGAVIRDTVQLPSNSVYRVLRECEYINTLLLSLLCVSAVFVYILRRTQRE